MSVCPWGNGSTTRKDITKEGLDFTGKGVQKGLTFGAGANMDKVPTCAPTLEPAGRRRHEQNVPGSHQT
jgi:hypothetical protein